MIGRVAAVCCAAALLEGCASIVAALPSKAAIAAAAAKASAYVPASSATQVALIGGTTAGGSVLASNHNAAGRLMGMSEANLYICTGPIGKKREIVKADVERWTYENRTCSVTLTLEKGFVTDVDFGSPAMICSGLMDRCI